MSRPLKIFSFTYVSDFEEKKSHAYANAITFRWRTFTKNFINSRVVEVVCPIVLLKITNNRVYHRTRPEGLGSMLMSKSSEDSLAEIVEVEIEVVSPSRPFGEVSLSLNRTVTCMVLKANDRRTSCPCHDEFRGPRSDYVRRWH
ncbi:secernin-1 [Trichonephila clavipes]|nr:secernin-1 [Trichonephila clavipes]